MPKTIGYPENRINRSQKNLAAVNRATTLLASAKRHRDTNREARWKRSEELWEGRHHTNAETVGEARDIVTVNMSFSTVNTIVPYITAADPQFIIEPYSGNATVRNARLLQSMLNRMWRSGRMAGNEHLSRAAWDALIYGDGFLKASYTMEEQFSPGTTDLTTIAELWVDRVSPWDVWIDPSSDGLHNARWCIVRVPRSLRELKDNPSMKRTSLLSAGDERDDTSGRERPVEETGDDRDAVVTVYEFYDIVNRELVVFTDQLDLPLQYVQGITCPLVQMSNHPIPKSPYSMGELEQLRWLQDELNKTRTQMVEHRRRNAQKWLVRDRALSQAARDALQSEDVNAVVGVNDDRPLEDVVMPLQVANLSADVYNVDAVIKQDIYEISGVNEYLRGSTPEIRRTATEATIIEGASNIKTAHKLRMVENAARKVGQLLLGMAADVFPLTDADEMTLVLTGKEAQAVAQVSGEADLSSVESVRLSPDDALFDGVYEVFVEQGSTELRNPVMREQKYREMAKMLVGMAPVLSQVGVQLNYRKVFELYFEAAGVDDIDGMFSMAPPPQGESQVPPPGTPGELPVSPELLAALGGSGLQAPPDMGGNGVPGGPPTDIIGPGNSGMMPPAA